jgi:hypothetical protein
MHNKYWPSGTCTMLTQTDDFGEKTVYEIADFSPLIRAIESMDIRKVLPERLAEKMAEELNFAYAFGLEHAQQEEYSV